MSGEFLSLLKKNKIIPVCVFDDPQRALKVAELLLKYSIDIIEVTIRTDSAYKCIEMIRKNFPEANVGAGSVLSIDSLNISKDRGACFAVAPCFDQEVVGFASSVNFPFVPGVSTPSELNSALKTCNVVKIFPAESLGGTGYIKAITAPFKLKEFYIVPTGGVNEMNYLEYLKLDNVISCGMSYIVDKKLIDEEDYITLEKRIKGINVK